MIEPTLSRAAGIRARRSRPRTVRVALAGCGAVGGALVRLLREAEPVVASRYGVRFSIVRVLVRGSNRARPEALAPELVTTDTARFLATPADVVVEAIGGLEAALPLARAVLRSGRRLVTANKTLIAAHGPELVRLAACHGARLDFESAVAGGVPVLRALRDQLRVTDIHCIRGVLNGTTNYLLTRMAAGEPFAEALAEAQRRGFAEADPARDLDGQDAADKLRILAWLGFGVHPARLPVHVRGLGDEPDRLVADAAAIGGVLRLVAECARSGDAITAAVEPVVVGCDSPIARLQGEENLVEVRSRWNGTVRFTGPGAGGGATASAVLADLVRGGTCLRGVGEARASQPGSESLHPWLLSCRAGRSAERLLATELALAGLTPQRLDRDDGSLRVLSWPAPRSAVRAAARRLAAAGLRPVVARVEP